MSVSTEENFNLNKHENVISNAIVFGCVAAVNEIMFWQGFQHYNVGQCF